MWVRDLPGLQKFIILRCLEVDRILLFSSFTVSQPIELRTDEELFAVDTKPKTLIRDSILCPRPKNVDDLKLKCFQGLENSSAVSDPVIKRLFKF